MKKIIIILLFAAAGYFLWNRYGEKGSNETIPKLETVDVTRGTLSIRVQSTATITPANKLEIKPPIAGRAEFVKVDIGSRVKQGDVLALMSSNERAALLDAARAKGEKEVKYWEDIYKPAPLVAPLDGQIISRTLVPGQVVQSSDVVFIMSDNLIAQADMDETDLAKIYLKQNVEVSLDSYPDQKIIGDVTKIAYNSKTTNNVTTYPVDVRMKDVPENARSGMTANVSFFVSDKENVLLLPMTAVSNGNTVLLPPPNPDEEPIAHSVTTGINDGRNVEIISGLKEGDKVLTTAYTLPSEFKQGMTILPRGTRMR